MLDSVPVTDGAGELIDLRSHHPVRDLKDKLPAVHLEREREIDGFRQARILLLEAVDDINAPQVIIKDDLVLELPAARSLGLDLQAPGARSAQTRGGLGGGGANEW